ncbi:Alpha-dioxygenase 2 [Capsicum baccatum]|uniref:Alpha-dioxygenase 2 n=1 Tax=Capsicum baccatum TaxID=33114 RepID=A0A2G2V0C7_CAPBA|nr:Alpha-dioxygenase 2 [Capsicum baccatum]
MIPDVSVFFSVVHLVDRFDLWHRLPVLLGLAYLGLRRHLHQRYNLLHVGKVNGKKYDTEEFTYRTADGTCNHPVDHLVGSQGTFFGRNMPPSTSSYGFLPVSSCTLNSGLPKWFLNLLILVLTYPFLGFYVHEGKQAKKMLKLIPKERILLETDAPDALPKLSNPDSLYLI